MPTFVEMEDVKEENQLQIVLKIVLIVVMDFVKLLGMRTFLLVRQIVELVVTIFVNDNLKRRRSVLKIVEPVAMMFVT